MDQLSPSLGTANALRCLALDRDPHAWATVLRLHGPQILLTTRRILGESALAEDACQETLLQIRDHAGQFRGAGEHADGLARNWIMRIAANTALKLLRTRKRAQQHEHNAAEPREFMLVDDGDKQKLAELVRTELAGMPEKFRRPLVLHFFAGLNYEQLAQELSCGVNAARVRVHRALEKLRARLQPLGLMVTAAALIALLEHAPAHAAEAVLSPERLVQWQNLLTSSQHAAMNVLADGQLPQYAKLGYAAATAVFCGALAFAPAKPLPQPLPAFVEQAPKPTHVAADTPVPASRNEQESLLHGMLNQTIAERATDVPQVVPTPRSLRARRPAADKPAVAPAPVEATAFVPAPAPSSNSQLISARAQLKLLHGMQQELNARIVRINQEIEFSGPSVSTRARLRKAADDQAILSDMLEIVARNLEDEARAAKARKVSGW